MNESHISFFTSLFPFPRSTAWRASSIAGGHGEARDRDPTLSILRCQAHQRLPDGLLCVDLPPLKKNPRCTTLFPLFEMNPRCTILFPLFKKNSRFTILFWLFKKNPRFENPLRTKWKRSKRTITLHPLLVQESKLLELGPCQQNRCIKG
ncbi:uncharacterized protein LOC120263233 [Dioscorea cayenensis subsp. rotundata]|uniref:Uncharacterized protein LOC120263233 n=1 Tax=Dioscorea cayennensis subsp. rotundata TaxID=55577 RepID=A0AB40BKZ1_DIOCR|nr:uncharacterized protein LOC120263233 [Dioscorea cayenensis subsp. rotundata]